MSRTRRMALLCSILAVAALCGSGCSVVKRISGPKWTPRPEPIAPVAATADLRDRDRLLFLVFGDSGTGKQDQRKVAVHMAEECAAAGGCDFALMAGDNIYEAGVRPSRRREDDAVTHDPKLIEKFEIPYEPLGRMDFWAVPGNHDWYTRRSVDTLVLYSRTSPRWRMLSHDYAIPHLPEWIRIYGLDTTRLVKQRESGQLERARESLCGFEGWKLLLGHHPVYASGAHANARGEFPKIRQQLLEPLIEHCGVHLYVSGHEHHQEHLSAPGFEQIIEGAAGKLRRVRRVEQRSPGVRQLAAASRFGFALFEATPDRLRIRFFGYARGGHHEEFYCRILDRKGFAEPELRSRPCEGEGSSLGSSP